MENRNKVLLYTNLVIQMGIIIGIGTYFGNYLDKSFQNQTPWWTLVLSLSSVFLAFYQIITTLKTDDQ
jgi:F0F1-type ATP synthase assembly protein I